MTKETFSGGATPALGEKVTGSAGRTESSNVITMKDFGIVEGDAGYVAETVEKLVRDANAALESCQALFGKVEGTTKLRKRIVSELKFLHGLNKTPEMDLSQVGEVP